MNIQIQTPTPSRFPTAGLLFISIWLLCAPASAQVPVVLAFGDSITHGFGASGVSCFGRPGGYPPRLRNILDDRGVAVETRTFGVCGELTSAGVSRIDSVIAGNRDASVILIMEGTNDLSSPSISTESMRFNLNTMVDKAEEAGLVPVLASTIPRAPEAGDNGRTGFLRALLQEDAQERGLIFADPYGGMVDIFNLYDRFYFDPFHPNNSGYDILTGILASPTQNAVDRLEPDICVPGPETLCLQSGRFRVEVEWQTSGDGGSGQAIPSTSDTGFFWFFNQENLELVVKVLDGRSVNGFFWVFYGALSDVEYTLTVTDTETRRQKIYRNSQGNQASLGDTEAFDG